ncbi:alanine racemase [Candidatus Woesebacteria bacterium]|nr:alanine racemase [Candidatus Woesebacteria bacterium]
MPFKTWVEISKGALTHNLRFFRKLVGEETKVLCVLKANAYGHGLKEVAEILNKERDADWFGVDNLEEALLIKKLGVAKPILVLGYTRLSNLKETTLNGISFVISNKETLEKIVSLKLNKAARVHLKIETGLNRQGTRRIDVLKILSFIKKHKKYIYLEGVYTHFADFEDAPFVYKQLVEFKNTVRLVKENGFKRFIVHSAATGATILCPNARFDMVRIGIGLYGLSPSLKPLNKELRAVASWKSVVAQVKEAGKDESVGYGRTWFAKKKTRIAVIPIGYSDGFDRHFSNKGKILVKGRFASVLGRVMMNMIVVDVDGIKNLNPEEEAILIGRSGQNKITAEDLAESLGTISYEVVSRINPLLPRVVV